MTEKSGNVTSGENPDLATMHRDLIALVRKLELSIDDAPTPAAIGAIADQLAEVNARVTSTGRVLLVRQTEEIARHAAAVSAEIPRIEEKLEDLQRFEQVVRGVTALLSTVDEAVRVASLVPR